MRYYDLTITDPSSAQVWVSDGKEGFSKAKSGTTFTSWVKGANDPGALNIEFDVPVVPFNTPQGRAYIRVWGVGLRMIGQAANLNGQSFVLRAGMQRGLPLAKPAQAGTILQGTIYQAFGNWQGVNQTLDLIVYPGQTDKAQDISFLWPANSSLSSAIGTTLQQAFPKYKQSIAISESLRVANDEAGHYRSLAQLSGYLFELSKKIGASSVGPSYAGVRITIKGDTIYVFDGTGTSRVVQLAFEDLIGQPTWLEPGTVSLKTVMRSDIAVGDQIKFPQGVISPFVLTSPAAAVPGAPARNQSIFQGKFVVTEVHHYANFRQPDADSWNTTFSAIATRA